MRYTEARLTAIATEMLADIDKDTVDFEDNYDGTQKQPSVLPAKLPNLLINGSSGIAVGMATNIPPHHLGEIVDAVFAYIDNPDVTNDELCQIVKGPDFPTGGSIFRYETRRNPLTGEQETIDAIREMYAHGHGRVVMRGQVAFEETRNDRTAIIVTELPYQVNKASLLEKIADLVKDKKIDGIADLRDESDRDGMRIVHRDQARREPAQGAEQPVQAHGDADGVQPQHARAGRRPAADPAAQERPAATTSTTGARSSAGAPSSTSRRRASEPTSSRASRSPSTTSTRSSRRSAARTTSTPRART